MMIQLKKTFLKNVALNTAINGGLSRNSIYFADVNSDKKKDFRNSLKEELSKVVEKILSKKKYTDRDHYITIEKFADNITIKHATILHKNVLNIGTSQKLINLYWKMLWVFDNECKTPIHCPFDSIIINKLDKSVRHIKWTKISEIEKYDMLVQAVKKESDNYLSIAVWELEIYNNQINNGGTYELQV